MADLLGGAKTRRSAISNCRAHVRTGSRNEKKPSFEGFGGIRKRSQGLDVLASPSFWFPRNSITAALPAAEASSWLE